MARTESGGDKRRSTLRALKSELDAARRFGAAAPYARPFDGDRELMGYISGFVSAEGYFGLSDARPRFAVHVRRDDKPLLELLAKATGLGKVSEHQPSQPLNPSATWTIAARAELAKFTDLLREGGLSGRKRSEMEVWADAVDELNRAARAGVRPRRELLEQARDRLAVVRTYKPPQRHDLLRVPRRDMKTESLAALNAWSRETVGKLSCTDYTRWRNGRADTPGRNTIVRHFGSWQGALQAAGLGDRLARAPSRVGGEVARAARREQQRARVVAAVHRFEREHGRRPRALEFFRWRLNTAVDAPTQATVYNLFPGGWSEVLQAAG